MTNPFKIAHPGAWQATTVTVEHQERVKTASLGAFLCATVIGAPIGIAILSKTFYEMRQQYKMNQTTNGRLASFEVNASVNRFKNAKGVNVSELISIAKQTIKERAENPILASFVDRDQHVAYELWKASPTVRYVHKTTDVEHIQNTHMRQATQFLKNDIDLGAAILRRPV